MKWLDTALETREKPWLGYSVSFAIFLSAFLLHWETGRRGYPFVTFMPAVMLAALFGGRVPGIIVAALSAITAWLFFIRPSDQIVGYEMLGLFGLTTAIILSVIDELYRAISNYRTQEALAGTMFHELQHRIANNLQFVSSLLNSQQRTVRADPALAEMVLKDAAARLQTMARIHRRLYDPKNAGVEFAALIRELSADLIDAMGRGNVTCAVDIPPIDWEQERLITLALLVTEIVTNSLKHAFDEGGGSITISLRRLDAKKYELTIVDDGKGFAAGFDPLKGSRLGMLIIQGLVDKLGGTLEMTGDAGTVSRIAMAA